MQKYNGPAPSVSSRAAKLVEGIVADADALRCAVTTGEAGERLIDMGAKAPGGLEAGRRLAEVCLGGLGTVTVHNDSGLKRWPLGITVHAANPVVACLGSQYAGWQITEQESGFFALGSGPARALSRVEALYKDLNYVDHYSKAALVIEGDKAPPASVARSIAAACGVQPSNLTILFAPTGCIAGSVQIAARVLEVALHKAHELHFPLEHIEDGIGTAPIAPPIPDFMRAMGRTNDAVIYGGRVQLFVRGSNDAAEQLAKQLPSSTCAAYGEPFADIFAAAGGDFYKIDPMLFSPAQVIVSNLDTGTSFHAGELAPDVVDKSFR
ncbi:Methenyltetrahydromethanopterin cyclohydrolase [Hyphomicrobium sp. 1Nfss2.1]|uniref:methenyltetrahydromethanopterin cyclohydrolase n=1 Tax=Hyphomicrobium sp. 1Nfss2.1 TaxID=3413936 RepID=UPI003C7D1AF4